MRFFGRFEGMTELTRNFSICRFPIRKSFSISCVENGGWRSYTTRFSSTFSIPNSIRRQYNRTRTNLADKFHYKHMRPVYLIILMEHSPEQFQKASPIYIHHRNIAYDSGIKLNDLEHISYISLDTFHETVQTICLEKTPII